MMKKLLGFFALLFTLNAQSDVIHVYYGPSGTGEEFSVTEDMTIEQFKQRFFSDRLTPGQDVIFKLYGFILKPSDTLERVIAEKGMDAEIVDKGALPTSPTRTGAPQSRNRNETYPIHVYYGPSGTGEEYYVTEDMTIEQFKQKFFSSRLKPDQDVIFKLKGFTLAPNDTLERVIKARGMDVEVINKGTRQPSPTRMEAPKPINMPRQQPQPSPSSKITIETPAGMGTVDIDIKYDGNDTIADIIKKLRQKSGISDKYEIKLFGNKFDPKTYSSRLSSIDKIYAVVTEKR
jgi:hypothetical protein